MDYEKACAFYNSEKLDSAFFLFNRYVNNADDTLKKGTAYRCMGDMQWEVGDLNGAEENAVGAIRTLDIRDTNHHSELSYAYHLLGNIRIDQHRYDEAILMNNNAKSFSTDLNSVLELVNGNTLVLQKKGEYNHAVAIYDSMLLLNATDKSLVARILDNRTKTKWLQNSNYNALPEFWYALKIRVDSQYNKGLNASYAHLSDYYAKSNPDSALWYAQAMLEKAKDIHSPEDVLEAIDKLIRLNSVSALKEFWYEQHTKINDSLQFSRDTTRSRFAFIRYDAQKSKADNLVLQQHISTQRLWMYVLIITALVIIALLWIWYDKRRKRIKQESENAIRDSNLRMSKKVHDVVANGLYGIMNELEHGKAIEKEPLITKIEGLYEKSRDISYEDTLNDDHTAYDSKIHDLFTSFTNDHTSVFVVGNQQAFWDNISNVQKNELYMVLKNIMINMKQHSQAKNVVVHFTQEDNRADITYKDDGIGFSESNKFGNGLNNTVSRIKSVNGDINFGKSEKGGALISISFPL